MKSNNLNQYKKEKRSRITFFPAPKFVQSVANEPSRNDPLNMFYNKTDNKSAQQSQSSTQASTPTKPDFQTLWSNVAQFPRPLNFPNHHNKDQCGKKRTPKRKQQAPGFRRPLVKNWRLCKKSTGAPHQRSSND